MTEQPVAEVAPAPAFGLLAPPLAWALQLVAGYSVEEAGCGRPDASLWGAGVDPLTAVVIGVCGALAIAGGVASIVALRAALGRRRPRSRTLRRRRRRPRQRRLPARDPAERPRAGLARRVQPRMRRDRPARRRRSLAAVAAAAARASPRPRSGPSAQALIDAYGCGALPHDPAVSGRDGDRSARASNGFGDRRYIAGRLPNTTDEPDRTGSSNPQRVDPGNADARPRRQPDARPGHRRLPVTTLKEEHRMTDAPADEGRRLTRRAC